MSLVGDVVRLLRAEGRPVRAMARSAVKASDLASLGAEVVQGDLVNAPSLARACAGATHVVAAAHGMLGSGRNRSEAVDDAGHRALVDAARAAGVAHFVYTSVLGASPGHPVDFFRTKYTVEQYVKGSGLSHTILRPSAFMETHAHTFNGKGIVERGKTTLLGRGTRPRNFVAVRDVAAMAVRALTDRTMRGQTIEIGGPENFTDNQVAALYGRVLGVDAKGHACAVRGAPRGQRLAETGGAWSEPCDALEQSPRRRLRRHFRSHRDAAVVSHAPDDARGVHSREGEAGPLVRVVEGRAKRRQGDVHDQRGGCAHSDNHAPCSPAPVRQQTAVATPQLTKWTMSGATSSQTRRRSRPHARAQRRAE